MGRTNEDHIRQQMVQQILDKAKLSSKPSTIDRVEKLEEKIEKIEKILEVLERLDSFKDIVKTVNKLSE